MTSITLFFLIIPSLGILLLLISIILAPHNPNEEKKSPFECGFHSHLGQNRTQFSISYYTHALLFLLFDLEILLVYPFAVSSYTNDGYGLVIMLIFFVLLSSGFAYELGQNALKIDTRQITTFFSVRSQKGGQFHISNQSYFYYWCLRYISYIRMQYYIYSRICLRYSRMCLCYIVARGPKIVNIWLMSAAFIILLLLDLPNFKLFYLMAVESDPSMSVLNEGYQLYFSYHNDDFWNAYDEYLEFDLDYVPKFELASYMDGVGNNMGNNYPQGGSGGQAPQGGSGTQPPQGPQSPKNPGIIRQISEVEFKKIYALSDSYLSEKSSTIEKLNKAYIHRPNGGKLFNMNDLRYSDTFTPLDHNVVCRHLSFNQEYKPFIFLNEEGDLVYTGKINKYLIYDLTQPRVGSIHSR